MSRIGFLGTGAMGSRMAARLVAAGHEVVVWNRTPEAAQALVAQGATRAGSAREAAAGAVFVFSMLSDDEAARAVWLDPDGGGVLGLGEGAIALECSTVTPGWIATLADAVEARGATLLDAPVAGSLPQAEAGQLVFLIGGPPAATNDVMPVLGALGAKIMPVGRQGMGATVKLAVNALLATQVALAAEIMGVLAKAGLTPAQTARILAPLAVTSPVLATYAQLMAKGPVPVMFPIDLMVKDLGYAQALAEAHGVAPRVLPAVGGAFAQAQSAGLGQENISEIAALYR